MSEAAHGETGGTYQYHELPYTVKTLVMFALLESGQLHIHDLAAKLTQADVPDDVAKQTIHEMYASNQIEIDQYTGFLQFYKNYFLN